MVFHHHKNGVNRLSFLSIESGSKALFFVLSIRGGFCRKIIVGSCRKYEVSIESGVRTMANPLGVVVIV